MPRVAIFSEPDGERKKDRKRRIVGDLTKEGKRRWEDRRIELAVLCELHWGYAPKVISDASVAEYLARGRHETAAYLKIHRPE